LKKDNYLRNSMKTTTINGLIHPIAALVENGISRNGVRGISVRPIPFLIAKELIESHHYLHSMPGGTKLTFGVFVSNALRGALTLGVGPTNAYRLVNNASSDDSITLTRIWLSDELPHNSESRVISIVVRSLKQNTSVKFVVSYADPAQGHLGIIYQATNWLYTGLSEPMPLYDLGDGVVRQSRSLAHSFGTHSKEYLSVHGIKVKLVKQSRKHRYIYFVDAKWKKWLKVPVLPYPKTEKNDVQLRNKAEKAKR
jgi:hypothetical protein